MIPPSPVRGEREGQVKGSSEGKGAAPEPYWADETCALYLGVMREVLPALGITADCIVADPPFECTSLAWDRWPSGWLEVAAQVSRSLWCFLPLRQFAEPPYRGTEFTAAGWKLGQDVITRKPVATSFARDRYRRCHEVVTHWYQGRWDGIRHEVPEFPHYGPDQSRRAKGGAAAGVHGARRNRAYTDTGTRLALSVLDADPVRDQGGAGGRSAHRTRKPANVLTSLITYACTPGGLVLDPFAGSCSSLMAARMTGRHAIGIEGDEEIAERAAWRLSQMALEAPADAEAS